MSNEQLQCPKCEGDLVQGFVPDRSYGGLLVQGWHPGRPEKSFWTSTKEPPTEGVPIGAFRCQKCGFLEFYSDPKFAAQ